MQVLSKNYFSIILYMYRRAYCIAPQFNCCVDKNGENFASEYKWMGINVHRYTSNKNKKTGNYYWIWKIRLRNKFLNIS